MNQHPLLDLSRPLQAWPKVGLIDASEGGQFKAVAWRPQSEQVTEQVTGEVVSESGSALSPLRFLA